MNIKSIFALGLAALTLTGFAAKPESYQGKPFPKFRMTDTNGKVVTNASLRGKVVLIDFWATWCGPCREATPTLQKLQQKYAAKGFVVIGADCSEQGPDAQKNAARAFAKQNKLTYRMTLMNDKLAESLGIEGIPTMFILDKNGVVRKVNVGYDDKEVPALDAAIVKLLKG